MCGLIFDNPAIPTGMMDCVLDTMHVWKQWGERDREEYTDELVQGLHAVPYALIMKHHAYANAKKPN